MKKILLLSTVALASLASCSDYEDQFNLPSQLTDVKNGTSLVLGGSDYSASPICLLIRNWLCRSIRKVKPMLML